AVGARDRAAKLRTVVQQVHDGAAATSERDHAVAPHARAAGSPPQGGSEHEPEAHPQKAANRAERTAANDSNAQQGPRDPGSIEPTLELTKNQSYTPARAAQLVLDELSRGAG